MSLTLYIAYNTTSLTPNCGRSFQNEADCIACVDTFNRIEAMKRLVAAQGVPSSLYNSSLLGSVVQELGITPEQITLEVQSDYTYTTVVIP